ncbi:hypothetical protein ABID58_005437 [Bradyrhizobium sp. S3.2.6]|uniref:hypothetical protein n=1 Tax=Bradyrhizobium sp. S3.2.6 TaxID=3156428 RepID=UPI0033937835
MTGIIALNCVNGARPVNDGSVPETIICAAVRASNGKIIRGQRHNDAIRALQAMDGYHGEQPHGEDQGFLTSTTGS